MIVNKRPNMGTIFGMGNRRLGEGKISKKAKARQQQRQARNKKRD